MRLAWLTDIHLNFCRDEQVEAFCAAVATEEPDAVLLGGDIAEAPTVERALAHLESRLARPIHFVLGNHDFYGGSIRAVRRAVAALVERSQWLDYLSVRSPNGRVVRLTESTGLIGHDGWADGRLGDPWGSMIKLNDYRLIEELKGLDRPERLDRLRALGDEAAAHVRPALEAALERFENIILLTHVPPFAEAAWFNGRTSDDEWLPHMSCSAVGDVLLKALQDRPDRRLTVLCGHTHGEGCAEILPKLVVKTGGAVYGQPKVQEVLVVE